MESSRPAATVRMRLTTKDQPVASNSQCHHFRQGEKNVGASMFPGPPDVSVVTLEERGPS